MDSTLGEIAVDESSLLRRIGRKNSNPAAIAALVIKEPGLIASLIAGLSAPQPRVKYKCEKVLRLVGEQQPEILYPHFDFFAGMLDCENSILKWGAIQNLANLARADVLDKLELILDRYLSPIPGPVMITAASTIGGLAKIAVAKPGLADLIAREILKVQEAHYQTAECRNVAIGHAVDAFDRCFDQIQKKTAVVAFVREQLKNTRPAVRKRAAAFLRKRSL
jgi:hypothetical protein